MTRRGAAIVNPAVRKFSRLLPVLNVCQMVGGAAVFHSSSYLLGATNFFGTVIGLTVVLVGEEHTFFEMCPIWCRDSIFQL